MVEKQVPLSVLVIDDDPRVIDVLLQAFEREGFVAQGAASAGEGFEKYLCGSFHAIMVDEALFAVDGLRLIRLIRLIDQKVTLLMISGVADLPTAVSALRIGADDYISKPFKLWDLKDRILTSINRRAVVARKNAGRVVPIAKENQDLFPAMVWDDGISKGHFKILKKLIPIIENRLLNRKGFTKSIFESVTKTASMLSVRESDLILLGQAAVLQMIGLGGQEPSKIEAAFSSPSAWREAWRGFAMESAELLDHLGDGPASCARLLKGTAALVEGKSEMSGPPGSLCQILWVATCCTVIQKWILCQPRVSRQSDRKKLGEIEANAGIKIDPSMTTAFLQILG